MRLKPLKSFVRGYQKLPHSIQEQIDKQLELLLQNPRHPSLNLKKMQSREEIWEGRISAGYRFTFQIEEDM
ncbi:MAG: hypothetical protein HQK57_01260 [Deltaproteobacteria bacterium]|nr:hypothetical protein [Deltaproteobacteria bacterium]